MELKCKKYGKGICKQKVKQKEIVALWTDPERLMPNIVSVQTGLWHGVQHASYRHSLDWAAQSCPLSLMGVCATDQV